VNLFKQFKTIVALAALVLSALSSAHAQSPARFSDPAQDIERVVDLIDRRLALMNEVAAWKWHAKRPIVDSERERAVLDASVADAQAIGLDGVAARRFFDAQIRMAREVQEQAFARWDAMRVSPPPGRDLVREIRPQLDEIGRELLVAVYRAANDLEVTSATTLLSGSLMRLQKHAVDKQVLSDMEHSLRALRIVRHADWATLQRVRVLRIGMTGDYAPFSYERDGALQGFDLMLATKLAEQWGVQVEFVRTSWPTLMDDFLHYRFDIAMSGISVTPERAVRADFATAYHKDGKAPISRCDDARRFSTLEQIDRPEVRVVVNPGGTNERFVRERIQRAQIRVYPDNRTVFDEILAGRADVMITDAIEVKLQALRHPTLCSTTDALFTEADKAIMLPRASDLTAKVDSWLPPQIVSGQVRSLLQDALEQAR